MPQDTILVVEDDPEMAAVLCQGFEQENLCVRAAHDGGQAVQMAQDNRFQAIVLDVMIPVMDGFTVARTLRLHGDRTPILMLTARDAVTDIVHGLDSGVDDYLTKPFSFLELSARVRALIRRASPAATRYGIGDLVLDVTTHQVTRGGQEIQLRRTEFQLLEILIRHKGHVVRRRDLFREVWGANTNVEENTLDVSISSLRSRLESGRRPRLIHTVRGFGYRLEAK